MKTKLVLTLALLVTLAVSSVNAQSIRNKSKNERARIAQGTRNGELTRGETHRLAKEQKKIRKEVKRAKRNDGHLSRSERARIKHDQRKASRHIYRAKNNKRDRK